MLIIDSIGNEGYVKWTHQTWKKIVTTHWFKFQMQVCCIGALVVSIWSILLKTHDLNMWTGSICYVLGRYEKRVGKNRIKIKYNDKHMNRHLRRIYWRWYCWNKWKMKQTDQSNQWNQCSQCNKLMKSAE